MNFHPKVALAFCCWSFCCELGNADTKKPQLIQRLPLIPNKPSLVSGFILLSPCWIVNYVTFVLLTFNGSLLSGRLPLE